MLLIKELVLPNGKNINISLDKNTGYLLSGKNGVGKSLLLKALANLYPIQYEDFEYGGKPLTSWTPEMYRSKVLYVPSVNYFTSDGSVEDFLNIPFQLTVHKNRKPNIDFEKFLTKWNLKGKKFSDLSSGEKQSLSFLRAIALNPDILLLDEPFSHLASERINELESILSNWHSQQQKSYLIVSHDPHQQKRLNLTQLDFDQLTT